MILHEKQGVEFMLAVDLSSIINVAPFMGLILILSGIGILFKTYSDSITLASILIIISGVLVIGSRIFTTSTGSFLLLSISF